MNRESDSHKRDDRDIWIDRKPASVRESSKICMNDTQKEMIRKALEHEIVDIRSYRGYRGDLLIEVVTLSSQSVEEIDREAKALGFEVVIQQDAIFEYKIFCILAADDIYTLK